jgi:transcriptional regulator with XRE-family HTH domain
VFLGARVKELRLEAELTATELASCSMQRPIVTRIEKGRHALSYDGLLRLAAALDLHPAEIICVLEEQWRAATAWTKDAWLAVPWRGAQRYLQGRRSRRRSRY